MVNTPQSPMALYSKKTLGVISAHRHHYIDALLLILNHHGWNSYCHHRRLWNGHCRHRPRDWVSSCWGYHYLEVISSVYSCNNDNDRGRFGIIYKANLNCSICNCRGGGGGGWVCHPSYLLILDFPQISV